MTGAQDQAPPPAQGATPSSAPDPAAPRARGLSRRTFLRGAAAGLVVVAGGLVWRADRQGVFSSEDGAAYDAWRTSGGTGTQAMAAAAILAASAHNMQNWRLHLDRSRIELFDDVQRSLGVVDPYRREAHLGLGCAWANLELAGPPSGFSVRSTLGSDPTGGSPVVTLDLTAAAARDDDPLYPAIRRRHSDRGPYPAETPGSDFLDSVGRTATSGADPVEIRWLTSPADLTATGSLLVDAAQALTADRAMSEDNFTWFRPDPEEIARHMDGLTLDGQGFSPFIEVAAKMLPATSRERGDQAWVDATRDVHTATARAYGLVIAPRGDLGSRLRAGRAVQRLHLALTSEGWAMQHLNQAVEMSEREQATHATPTFTRRLSDIADGADVIGMVRTGRPSGRSVPTPRRPVTAVS